MQNLKPLIKRIGAYLIDLLVVWVLALLVTIIPVFNKPMGRYQKVYDQYVEDYNSYTDYIKLLDDLYVDETITEEEYTKLIEEPTYESIITEKYEDKLISKEEHKEIVEEINNKFEKELDDYNYTLSKKGIFTSIVTLSTTLVYFGIIQYIFKGQTLGKKMLKIKVVSASDKKLTVFNYLLRSLIINEVLLNAIKITFLAFATRSLYTTAGEYIGIAISIVEGIIIFLVMTREDQRGLHDILFNTKVISVEDTNETINIDKKDKKHVIDATYQESE